MQLRKLYLLAFIFSCTINTNELSDNTKLELNKLIADFDPELKITLKSNSNIVIPDLRIFDKPFKKENTLTLNEQKFNELNEEEKKQFYIAN